MPSAVLAGNYVDPDPAISPEAIGRASAAQALAMKDDPVKEQAQLNACLWVLRNSGYNDGLLLMFASLMGTPGYTPPEVLLGVSANCVLIGMYLERELALTAAAGMTGFDPLYGSRSGRHVL